MFFNSPLIRKNILLGERCKHSRGWIGPCLPTKTYLIKRFFLFIFAQGWAPSKSLKSICRTIFFTQHRLFFNLFFKSTYSYTRIPLRILFLFSPLKLLIWRINKKMGFNFVKGKEREDGLILGSGKLVTRAVIHSLIHIHSFI